MKFGYFSVDEARNALLAHSIRLNSSNLVLKKGTKLSQADINTLKKYHVHKVWAAILDSTDIHEDQAAIQLAESVTGPGVYTALPSKGRVYIRSEHHGLFTPSASAVSAINLLDERLTLATLPAFSVVKPQQIVATSKTIPFAVPQEILLQSLQAALNFKPALQVHAFTPKKVALILSELPHSSSSQLDRALRNQIARVRALGSEVKWSLRCPHNQVALCTAIENVLSEGAELVLILGASAMVDSQDVLPQAIRSSGGQIHQVGMPTDPGNLLVLGQNNTVPIIGIPGCARSSKRNGFDIVLERVAANLPISSLDIRNMGVGGIFTPKKSNSASPAVAGIVLAAGRSTRMGKTNKLLEKLNGESMVVRVVQTLCESPLDGHVIVVTGHEADLVEKALQAYPVKFVHNSSYAEGLSTSLKAGLNAIEHHVAGALVALGDMPLISKTHTQTLIETFQTNNPQSICVPTYNGKRGNPVILSSQYFSEARAIEGDVGARVLLKRYPNRIREVPLDDPGIILDVDTPDELKELIRDNYLEPSDCDDLAKSTLRDAIS